MAEDEFDSLPDFYEGIDFDHIPELSSTHNNDDEDASTPSSHYSFDELDDSALAEIDAIEMRLTTETADNYTPAAQQSACQPSSSSSNTTDTLPNRKRTPFTTEIKPHHPAKRPHADDLSPRKTPRRLLTVPSESGEEDSCIGEGQQLEKPCVDSGLKKVLEGFEDEMTCPICFDIFAHAHLGNPCGHSFCGGCGHNWISNTRSSPTCAVCRTRLSTSAPMIPNFSLDNTVEKHVRALGGTGMSGWQTGGIKWKEWTQRKEKWKADVARREAETKKRALQRSKQWKVSGDMLSELLLNPALGFRDDPNQGYHFE